MVKPDKFLYYTYSVVAISCCATSGTLAYLGSNPAVVFGYLNFGAAMGIIARMYKP